MIDLISETVGGHVVFCTDDFFAPVSNLLRTQAPVWKEGEYTDRGKWMDGWESRRRRDQGNDWCDIALGIPGRIEQVTVDTSHFTGNYPESFSLESCGAEGDDPLEAAEWVEIIPMTSLQGDAVAVFGVEHPGRATHVRLKIYPDGGVARLGIEGFPIPAKEHICPTNGLVNLASSMIGAEVIMASDTHYSPPSNLLRPTGPRGMWDGWETKRRRGPGHDWVVVRLGAPGMVHSIGVDTTFFKGNAPGWVSIDLSGDGSIWTEAVGRYDISPDDVATIDLPVALPASYLRLNIHPDGGLARLRVHGHPTPEAAAARRVEYVNSLFPQGARSFFTAACSAARWVGSMVEGRPFLDTDDVLGKAEIAFDSLQSGDWLEAFAAHPRIGESGDAVANREQAGVSGATRGILAALKKVNREYEAKFGFTYIVFASGKSASEMLAIAQTRLANDREVEISAAGDQQRLITRTRLRRMLCLEPSS